MKTQGEHIRTLRRRVDFLQARDHKNSYDQAELGALEWALVNLPPAQRTWVGLTNDEVNEFAAGCHLGNSVQGAIYKAEAKLKEKNNG